MRACLRMDNEVVQLLFDPIAVDVPVGSPRDLHHRPDADDVAFFLEIVFLDNFTLLDVEHLELAALVGDDEEFLLIVAQPHAPLQPVSELDRLNDLVCDRIELDDQVWPQAEPEVRLGVGARRRASRGGVLTR